MARWKRSHGRKGWCWLAPFTAALGLYALAPLAARQRSVGPSSTRAPIEPHARPEESPAPINAPPKLLVKQLRAPRRAEPPARGAKDAETLENVIAFAATVAETREIPYGGLEVTTCEHGICQIELDGV